MRKVKVYLKSNGARHLDFDASQDMIDTIKYGIETPGPGRYLTIDTKSANLVVPVENILYVWIEADHASV